MESFKQYLQYQKQVTEAKLNVIDQFMKGTEPESKKRTSKIDITWRVLKNAGQPLHVSEIIQMAQSDFKIQLERDSIVSGIIKKINAGKMFVKTAPNTFALKE
jgi:hypothetical protein